MKKKRSKFLQIQNSNLTPYLHNFRHLIDFSLNRCFIYSTYRKCIYISVHSDTHCTLKYVLYVVHYATYIHIYLYVRNKKKVVVLNRKLIYPLNTKYIFLRNEVTSANHPIMTLIKETEKQLNKLISPY